MLDKDLFQTKHNAIYDPEFQKHLAEAPWKEWLSKPGYFEVRQEYLKKIHEWIHSTEANVVKGLARFKHRDMINGTTQAFDEAYYRYSNKRLRLLRGEYAYHKRVVGNLSYLDDENGNYIPVEENDWVIVSYPFCGNGDIPPHFDQLQDDCLKKNVPLLLDCAWFGTCRDIYIDVNHPAITEVCFSLTKGIGLGNIRSGIRYSNYEDNLPIRQQNNYNHLPLGAAQVGIWQMQKFGPDFIPNKYYDPIYKHVCFTHNLKETNCMMIAMLDKDHPDYNQYLIDGLYSKVGIREAVKKQRQTNPDPIFCRAPFTSIYYREKPNSVAFCCVQKGRKILSNGETVKDWWQEKNSQQMREDFIWGTWPKACSECQWTEENAGIDSDRRGFDKVPLENININTGNKLAFPQYVDYRPDNLCNLMCTMCSPGNSNLVEKMWDAMPDVFGKHNSLATEDNVDFYDTQLINKHTVKLKVLGGEPTINKKVHRVFNYCIENDFAKSVNLSMTTNFTNLNSTYNLIDKFNSVGIQASLDGTGDTYEYIRRPAKWKQIKKNIKEFIDKYSDNDKYTLGINLVFQPVNAFTVDEWLYELLELHYLYNTEKKHKKFSKTPSVLLIDYPAGFTFGILPEKYKEQLKQQYNKMISEIKSNDPIAEQKKYYLDLFIKYVDYQSYSFKELNSFKRKTLAMDGYKKTDITKLHPVFKELLEYEE